MPTAASAASPQRKRALPTKPLAIQAVRSFTDLGAAANLAYNFVKAYAERAHAPKLAKQHARSLPSVAPKAHLPLVVFDIDATLLNESETGKAPAVPIKQTLELLKKLQKKG